MHLCILQSRWKTPSYESLSIRISSSNTRCTIFRSHQISYLLMTDLKNNISLNTNKIWVFGFCLKNEHFTNPKIYEISKHSPFQLPASRNLTKIQIYKIQNTNIQNTKYKYTKYKLLTNLQMSSTHSSAYPASLKEVQFSRLGVSVSVRVCVLWSPSPILLFAPVWFWSAFVLVNVYVSNPQRIFVYVYAYTCVCILWSPWPILLCAPLSWETLVGAEMDLGAF